MNAAPSPRPWLLLFGVLVLIAACYVRVLGAPFLWDDTRLVGSPLVSQLAPLPSYFEASFWQADDTSVVHSYYRPLVILSLALDHWIYGANAGGFHLTNLVFHLAAAAILFRLLRVQGASGYVAALCSALWGLHPRLTEAAAWVSGRTDVLAGFFVLGALLVQVSETKLARVATACLLLLGLFCKETALAGVLVVLIGEWQRTPRASARALRLAPTLTALAVYLWLRLRAVGLPTNLLHVRPGERALAVLEAVGRYAWMAITPWLPDAQIGNLRRRNVAYVVLGAIVASALVGLLWRRRTRLASATVRSLALALGALGLALYAIPFSFSAVAADRFLYLPLAGSALLVAPLIGRNLAGSRVRAGLALAVIASFGVATSVRAGVWSDEVEFWVSTLRNHPEEPSMASIALASAFSREGLFAESLAVLRRAATPFMDMRELAQRNSGITRLRAGDYAEASRVFDELLRAHPKNAVYALDLALAELSLAHLDAARQTLDGALRAAPADAALTSLRAQLPLLAERHRVLESWPASKFLVERARLEQSLDLRREAAQSFGQVLADPSVTPALAEEATWFALRFGDAATRQAFFTRYAALVKGRTEPTLQLAYDTHRASLSELRRAWPTLGLAR